MNTVVVVVVVAVVATVLIATALFIRSIAASPKRRYRRNLEDIPKNPQGPSAGDPVIRVDRDDWLGTSDHLG
jgi:hypothetical protein